MRFQQQGRQGWASCPVSSTHQHSAALHLPTPQLARPLPFCPGREAACHRGCVPLGVCDGPALLCHELQRRAPMEERVPVATSRPQGAIGFKLDTCRQGRGGLEVDDSKTVCPCSESSDANLAGWVVTMVPSSQCVPGHGRRLCCADRGVHGLADCGRYHPAVR